MNAFQPMIRNILEGKQLTDYHQKIKIVEKITKTNCGWPLHYYYIYRHFYTAGVLEIFRYLQELESDVKSTAIIFTTRINKFIDWPELNKFWLFYMYFP